MVVVAEEDRVNHGDTTSMNGQASHCRRRHCCASQTTEFGRPSQLMRLLEFPQRRFAVTGISQLVSM